MSIYEHKYSDTQTDTNFTEIQKIDTISELFAHFYFFTFHFQDKFADNIPIAKEYIIL